MTRIYHATLSASPDTRGMVSHRHGSSSPIHYTSVFSDVELDLPIDWLPIIVVFEIQAHAVTRKLRILNFFVPNSGSPCCTQSSIIFTELNFHQEHPVELFVQGVSRRSRSSEEKSL